MYSGFMTGGVELLEQKGVDVDQGEFPDARCCNARCTRVLLYIYSCAPSIKAELGQTLVFI